MLLEILRFHGCVFARCLVASNVACTMSVLQPHELHCEHVDCVSNILEELDVRSSTGNTNVVMC